MRPCFAFRCASLFSVRYLSTISTKNLDVRLTTAVSTRQPSYDRTPRLPEVRRQIARCRHTGEFFEDLDVESWEVGVASSRYWASVAVHGDVIGTVKNESRNRLRRYRSDDWCRHTVCRYRPSADRRRMASGRTVVYCWVRQRWYFDQIYYSIDRYRTRIRTCWLTTRHNKKHRCCLWRPQAAKNSTRRRKAVGLLRRWDCIIYDQKKWRFQKLIADKRHAARSGRRNGGLLRGAPDTKGRRIHFAVAAIQIWTSVTNLLDLMLARKLHYLEYTNDSATLEFL